MLARTIKLDATLARTGRLWLWLGQLGLVVLGVHLAADQLDDLTWRLLGSVPLGPEDPTAISAWVAVVLELAVGVKAAGALLLTPISPPLERGRWWRARSVDAVVVPVFWAMVALAGSWSLAMGLEDLVAPQLPEVARPLAWACAALVAWRLGWTGWRRVVGSMEPPKSVLQGLLWAPLLVAVTVMCAIHGLPVWGWLS